MTCRLNVNKLISINLIFFTEENPQDPSIFHALLERHSGARTSGSGCDQLLLARPALLAFSTSVRFVLHVYTVLIWYSALPRHCLSLSERGKEVAQASVAHTTRTRAPSPLLSLSLPLLSLVSRIYLARANLYTTTVRSHALEHAREPCSWSKPRAKRSARVTDVTEAKRASRENSRKI